MSRMPQHMPTSARPVRGAGVCALQSAILALVWRGRPTCRPAVGAQRALTSTQLGSACPAQSALCQRESSGTDSCVRASQSACKPVRPAARGASGCRCAAVSQTHIMMGILAHVLWRFSSGAHWQQCAWARAPCSATAAWGRSVHSHLPKTCQRAQLCRHWASEQVVEQTPACRHARARAGHERPSAQAEGRVWALCSQPYILTRAAAVRMGARSAVNARVCGRHACRLAVGARRARTSSQGWSARPARSVRCQ